MCKAVAFLYDDDDDKLCLLTRVFRMVCCNCSFVNGSRSILSLGTRYDASLFLSLIDARLILLVLLARSSDSKIKKKDRVTVATRGLHANASAPEI
jgi:hypothetical protein